MAQPATTSDFLTGFPGNRRLLWPGYVLVMCLLSALCFGSLKDLLLDMDDHEAFQDNVRMAEDFSFFFSSGKQQPGGRPLAELIKLAGYLVRGNDPGFFHLLVVAFHTLAALLLAILFRRQGMALRMSLAGGLLFLVNVAHFRAVHWIAAIEFPLALSCGLGALICYGHFLEQRRSRWLWAFYAASVLAVAALSAMAFLWPFCLYWSWLRKHDLRASLRPLLPLLPVVALELAGIVALTPRENSTWRAIDQLTEGDPFAFLLGTGRLLLWMLSRLLTTAHWLPVPVYESGSWELYAGAAVLAGLGAAIYRSPRPVSLWSVWILLSVLPFLPVNDTLILGRPEGPSRYLYPATAGTSLLLAWGLEEGSRRLGSWRRYLYGVLLTAILVSSWFSLKQAEAVSLYASGRNYVARGDVPTGVAQLTRAIRQGPDAIDLESTYAAVCLLTIGDRKHRFFLRQAREAYPANPRLNLLWLVVRSMDADSTIAAPAWKRLKRVRDSSPGTRVEVAPEVWMPASEAGSYAAAAYHKVGTGFLRMEGDPDRAVLAYTRPWCSARTASGPGRFCRSLSRQRGYSTR